MVYYCVNRALVNVTVLAELFSAEIDLDIKGDTVDGTWDNTDQFRHASMPFARVRAWDLFENWLFLQVSSAQATKEIRRDTGALVFPPLTG